MSESLAQVTGQYPKLSGEKLPSFWGATRDNYLEGFASSAGSSISLPTSETAALTLYSVTGSTLWTKAAPTNVDAAADAWVGFWMNADATLLYVITVDDGTIPDTFFLSSINAAGTVVNIGNDAPSSDFLNEPSWSVDGWIQPDGSGGFKIFSTSATSANNQYAIMNSSGVFTTDPTALYTNSSVSNLVPGYETTDGNLLFRQSFVVANNSIISPVSNKTEASLPYLPLDSNLGAGSSTTWLMDWKDYVVNASNAASVTRGNFKYTPAQAATYVSELLSYSGVTPL